MADVKGLIEEYKELKYKDFSSRFKKIHEDETKTIDEKVNEILAAHVAYEKSDVLEMEIERMIVEVDLKLAKDVKDITEKRWNKKKITEVEARSLTGKFVEKAFAAAGYKGADMATLYDMSHADYITRDQDIARLIRNASADNLYDAMKNLIQGGRGLQAKELLVKAMEARERNKRNRELTEYTLPRDNPEVEEAASSYIRKYLTDTALTPIDQTKLKKLPLHHLVSRYVRRRMHEDIEEPFAPEKAEGGYKHREEGR